MSLISRKMSLKGTGFSHEMSLKERPVCVALR